MYLHLLQIPSIPEALVSFSCFSWACQAGLRYQGDLLEQFQASTNPLLVSWELLATDQPSQTTSATRMRYQALMGPAGSILDRGLTLSCGIPSLLTVME